MNKKDLFIATCCGAAVAATLSAFFDDYGIVLPWYWIAAIAIGSGFFSAFCLWLAWKLSYKFIFVFQVAKHVLIGAFATIIDLNVFQLLFWIVSFFVPAGRFAIKAVSFIAASLIKFYGNKLWVFQKRDTQDQKAEIFKFYLVVAVGLLIDMSFFYFFTKITGPLLGASDYAWLKISVLFSASIAAIWNFVGDKFLVFKK